MSLAGSDADIVRMDSSTLIDALESEVHTDVRVEIIRALGRLGTADAVQRLLRLLARTPEEGDSTECRVAAVEALVEARGAAALPALRALFRHRDVEVAEAARAAVDRADRTGARVPA